MRLVAVLLLVLFSCGCATVMRGTSSHVGFDSEPAGAEVRTSQGLACVTPCSLTFSRREEFIATFSKAGYEPQQVEGKTQIHGEGAAGVMGNVVIGGVVGIGVDAVSGAAYDHVPNPVVVKLRPVGPGSAPPRRRRDGPLRPPPEQS
jgi:hypothetical protein